MKTEFTCHGAFYKRRAKNAANCASACSPIDFVSVLISCLGIESLINETEVTRIMFRVDCEAVRPAEGT